MKRVIQKSLVNLLSEAALRGEFSEGDQIKVDRGPGGALVFSKDEGVQVV